MTLDFIICTNIAKFSSKTGKEGREYQGKERFEPAFHDVLTR